ncbi:MAG: NAD(P)-dependent oxidoreductase [Pseudomonadota bacterium]
MKSFPVFLGLSGQRVVVVGGGEEAAQKVRLMRRTEAEIVVMAPELVEELADLVARGLASHIAATLDAGPLSGARLVIVATGCAGADGAAAALARAQGALVNVVDRPDFCDVTTPAIVDRDPVVVAIGTEGTAPVLSRQIKSRIEAMLEPSVGRLSALAGSLRPEVAYRVAPPRRRAFWEWFFNAPRALFAEGRAREAEAAVEAALAAGAAPEDGNARIALIDVGPGPADLVTLRAVQRMQSADVVLHAGLRDPALLELPRRDAERIALSPGADAAEALIEAAAEARRIVYLAHGQGCVDTARLEDAGLDWERIAGVASVGEAGPALVPVARSAAG